LRSNFLGKHKKFLLAIVVIIILVRGCAFRPETQYSGSHYNRGENAIWLGVEWVSALHSTAEVTALGYELTQHQIEYVFAYTTFWRSDIGAFNQTVGQAASFVTTLKAAQPKIRVLAWIGLPLPSIGGGVDLADIVFRQKVVALSVQFVKNVGFDGVQYDPEIVSNGDQNLIALLVDTRQALGIGPMLSLAAEKIQPVFPDLSLFGHQIDWSTGYYHQLASHVDQLAVMSYDTRMPLDGLYRELMRFEVIGPTHALNGMHVQLLLGIPASDESSATHNPTVESIANGLQGAIDGLNDADTVAGIVNGVAIYPAWDMNDSKWAIYDHQWLSKTSQVLPF
jgi:hypothetical protein